MSDRWIPTGAIRLVAAGELLVSLSGKPPVQPLIASWDHQTGKPSRFFKLQQEFIKAIPLSRRKIPIKELNPPEREYEWRDIEVVEALRDQAK